jgi:hypothetical protein
MASIQAAAAPQQHPKIQPCRYKVGKTLGAGSYSVVKECVHIDTGRYYAAKVINKTLMAGREHMVGGRARPTAREGGTWSVADHGKRTAGATPWGHGRGANASPSPL